MMNDLDRETTAALMLAALGNETRLRLFRLLVRAGHEGQTVGAIQHKLGVPASTLAHHLNALVGAGLVSQQRRGREVRSIAQYAAMDGLVAYLTEACCAEAASTDLERRCANDTQSA